MGEEVIHTDVDRLLDILKTKKKIDLKQMAKELEVPEEIVQQWVDFLVEEKIVMMDYEFTKPVISIIEKTGNSKKQDIKDILQYKQDFQKTKVKQKENTAFLWKKHILENLEIMKQFFYVEAEKRGLMNIDQLWEDYRKKVEQL